MKRWGVFTLLFGALLLSMVACSSTPKKQELSSEPVVLTAADSAVIQKAIEKKVYPQNLDIAHESFIRAQEMELRGEKQLAEVFMQRAYEADPGNRYLAFTMAQHLFAHGSDSAAFALAKEASSLNGQVRSSDLALLAKLYVKEGIADSARKYFKAALDSSKNQDMSLVYDYSLFLEAVQDKEELVRVYDLLLPQINYIQSLFQRQVRLLLDLGRDSALVDLFGRAHEATGDMALLEKMVQGLVLQQRVDEARAIADTVSGSNELAESIILMVYPALGGKDRNAAFELLMKKYYEDGVKTPLIAYHLGNQEYAANMKDSARVHLTLAYDSLVAEKPNYAAQAARSLAGIAFVEGRKKDGVRYAEMADSILPGGDKEFLAMAYGFAGQYDRAYGLLDTLLKVWSEWRPMEGVADSATVEIMMKKAQANHRRAQSTYASLLVSEAREIEMDGKSDSLKLSRALECRQRAELFWESMIMVDSSDLALKLAMAKNLERMERYEDSFRIFEELLTLDPKSGIDLPDLQNYYGYTLIDLNRSEAEVKKGYELVMKALELEQDSAAREAYLDSQAWALYRMGRFAEALEVMKQIKGESFQDDHVYWEHMGAIYNALGMKSEATAAYQKLLKLRPNHEAAKEFLGKKK